MYENIYTYSEEVEGKNVWLLFKPNFREALTLMSDRKDQILSDREIRIEEKSDPSRQWVYASEDAQWLLADEGYSWVLYVTEKTTEIITPLGEKWNREFKRLLKKCKKDYYQQKKEEVRLYFYDLDIDRLSLCGTDIHWYNDSDYTYSLRRLLPTNPYCAIDRQFPKPDKSCFVLGRIRKTIGLKDSKLLDFVEPVHEIELDFEKNEWDFTGCYYKGDWQQLEEGLLDLLRFCISKENDLVQVMRIRAYFGNYEASQREIIMQFRGKIWENFKKGDAKELRKLSEVLNKKQCCTNVRFQLRLDSEVECSPEKRLTIYFENGEEDRMPAKWIYENINNCTDAKGVHFELRNRYNFY